MEEQKRASSGEASSLTGSAASAANLLKAGWWRSDDGRRLLATVRSAPVGILERMSDEVRTPAGAYSKVRVKVVLRGKSGCGKSVFVASACGDSDLTDKYLTSVGLSVRHCLWPVKTVAERVFVTQLEFWDASFDAHRTVGHFKEQLAVGKDVVVHVVSLRDKFLPKALEKQIRDENARVTEGAPVPAHVVLVTKADSAALSTRVTPFQQVAQWADSHNLQCVRIEPTAAATRAAASRDYAAPAETATALDAIAAAALSRRLQARAAANISGMSALRTGKSRSRLAVMARRVARSAKQRRPPSQARPATAQG